MSRKKGFTLIELIVVIAIVAVLATIATVTSLVVIKNNNNKKILTEIEYNFEMIEKTIKNNNGLNEEDFKKDGKYNNDLMNNIFEFDQISSIKFITISSNYNDLNINNVEEFKITIKINTDTTFKNSEGNEVGYMTKVINAPHYKIFKGEFKLKKIKVGEDVYKMVIDNE